MAPLSSIIPQPIKEDGQAPLSVLADAMPQLVWIARSNGEVFYYNNRVAEFAGAFRGEDGLWKWHGLLHEEDLAPTEEAWAEAVRTRKIYQIEHRVKMRDGQFRWHLSRAFPQKDENDEVVQWFGTATDIHEQKLVEERVKVAEKRWRTALEATEMGTWEYNPNTGTFFLSDVARQIRGLGAEAENPFPLQRSSIHPDDVNLVSDAMVNALERGDGGVFTIEYRVQKGGIWNWIRSIGRVIAEEGEPKRVIGIMQDVTQQRLADENLRYLAAVTKNIGDAVIGTGIDNTITNWNSGAERTYGWTAAEVLGRSAKEVLKTEFFSAGEEKDWQERFNRDGNWQGEVQQQHKNGRKLTILASVARVLDAAGNHLGGVGINRDMTTQRQASELLKESEARFRILTNTIPQIVWVTDIDGNMEYLNEQWYRVTGQTVAEALENRREVMHQDDIAPMQEKWEKARANGEGFEAEYRLKNKHTGIYRWFFCKIQPLKGSEGEVLKWIGASSDIQQFKNASEVLEELVEKRTSELKNVNEVLQHQAEELFRSNEDLQQFAHVASHDLKEPLRKIKTYSSRLSDEFGDTLPEKAKAYLQKMDSAATRMASMIDGVLGYSMLGVQEELTDIIDLNDLIDQIQGDLEVLIARTGATLRFEGLPVIKGSAVLIYQLFYNLIGNSLKFIKPDVPPVITISAGAPETDFVSVYVSDNGIGFEQAYAEKIFKTFTRLNAKDLFEGTGLGLSLCEKIVKRHGGTITASGKLHEGASFHVRMPASSQF